MNVYLADVHTLVKMVSMKSETLSWSPPCIPMNSDGPPIFGILAGRRHLLVALEDCSHMGLAGFFA